MWVIAGTIGVALAGGLEPCTAERLEELAWTDHAAQGQSASVWRHALWLPQAPPTYHPSDARSQRVYLAPGVLQEDGVLYRGRARRSRRLTPAGHTVVGEAQPLGEGQVAYVDQHDGHLYLLDVAARSVRCVGAPLLGGLRVTTPVVPLGEGVVYAATREQGDAREWELHWADLQGKARLLARAVSQSLVIEAIAGTQKVRAQFDEPQPYLEIDPAQGVGVRIAYEEGQRWEEPRLGCDVWGCQGQCGDVADGCGGTLRCGPCVDLLPGPGR